MIVEVPIIMPLPHVNPKGLWPPGQRLAKPKSNQLQGKHQQDDEADPLPGSRFVDVIQQKIANDKPASVGGISGMSSFHEE